MYSFFNIGKGMAAVLMIGMLAACTNDELTAEKKYRWNDFRTVDGKQGLWRRR